MPRSPMRITEDATYHFWGEQLRMDRQDVNVSVQSIRHIIQMLDK